MSAEPAGAGGLAEPGGAGATITVRVRLFAMLREAAGRGELELVLPAGETLAGARRELAAAEPELGRVLEAMTVRAALNRDYADERAALSDGDEIALIPPVSGGAQSLVGTDPLSIDELARAVGRPGAGAIVVFAGTTRTVERLDYEAYAEMASERIAAIVAEIARDHGLEAIEARHRIGPVALGEASVLVAVSGAHRAETFAGAREAIDRIKAEAPIWKREVEGERAEWVEGTPPPLGDPEAPAALTHLDSRGTARMVDVGAKQVTRRVARAEARVRMSPATARAVAAGDAPKGDVLGTARIAGIGAAKRTWELIPLAHPLALDHVEIEADVDPGEGLVTLWAEASTSARTGVEMEAMTAASVAALTIYDMVKGVERGVSIERLELVLKRGGKSGEWRRDG